MSTNTAPPGWHPDPAAPQVQLRWWDGARWTEHVQPQAQQAMPQPAQSVGAGGFDAGQGWQGGAAWQQTQGWGYATPFQGPVQSATFAQQNKFSLITGAIVAAYVVIAMTTRIVFIGILPVLMSVRAVRRREPLGPVAVGAAILAVIIAFAALAGR
ncbi:MAG TPA: DUF2510 domain-containing protein [Acidimicrobiales bacterium]